MPLPPPIRRALHLVAVLTACGLTATVTAQTFAGYVTAGPTFSQVDGDMLAGYNHAGAYAGLGVYLDLADRWRTSLAISYAQGGSKASAAETLRQRSIYDNITLDYVAVPVGIHYMDWLSADEFFYHLEFVFAAEYRRLIRGEAIDVGGAEFTDLPFRDNSVGATLGAWYAWSLDWAAGIHYARGLVGATADATDASLLTQRLSLQLRYTF